MNLIIESGATKADWTIIGDDGGIRSFQTDGLNFSSGDEEFVFRTLESAAIKVLDMTDAEVIDEVDLYAAGLFFSEDPQSPYQLLENSLSNRFPGAAIFLENDLLAAARALFGNRPGIACILGTGSNACLYDGTSIIRKTSSGGFILGDEGGAAALGRIFISDLIKGLVPECVALAFKEKYDLDYPEIVRQVYHGASPAAYLGKFAPDILAFYDTNPYMHRLVDDNFRAFIERCILCIFSAREALKLEIDAGSRLPVGAIGGFAFACREILESVAGEEGISFESVLKSPSERLIEYHSTK